MKPDDYKRITYDLTLEMGRRLARLSSEMTFCYVTGAGTDSTEKGSIRWARIKGATENELLRLFKNGYMFRPAAMYPKPNQKNIKSLYRVLFPLFSVFKPIFPNSFCTLEEVGRAMLVCTRSHPASHIIDVPSIKSLAMKH